MAPLVRSVLTHDAPFDADWIAHARRKLIAEKHDVPTLLRQANADVVPAQQDWITDRLRLLWKSTTPTNNMEAVAWLHETGRLIKHLPQDILAFAIDEAVRRSEKNFTPAAGAILAAAEPMMREREMIRARLDILVNGEKPKPRRLWEIEDMFDPKERCTPEEAAAILKDIGLDMSAAQTWDIGRDYSKLRQPTAQDIADIAAPRSSIPAESDIRSPELLRRVEARRADRQP